MPHLTQSTPKYRKHKASGQAIVTIRAHDFYLGPWNSKASKIEYDRIIGEWLAAGRQLPIRDSEAADLTVVEILARFKSFAVKHYRKAGDPTGEWENIRHAIEPLRRLYGRTLAREFGPVALKALRQEMIDAELSRGVINSRVRKIKRIFRWGVSEQLVPTEVVIALETVEGLQMGRTTAREAPPVTPVPDEIVDKTLRYLPEVVADMVRFQRLTACRPGEVCVLRPCDVDRSGGDIWVYRPKGHKSEHQGRKRTVFIGSKAQAVLLPYLLRDADSYCFSPLDTERKRLARMRANRKTKVQPSQLDRSKKNAKRKPGERYTTNSFGYAIRRASEKAGVERWGPNRLRHTAATRIREQFGLEAAQTVLGHAKADTSEIYAERDSTLAARVMADVG